MNRRAFLKSLAAASAASLAGLPHVQAALPKMKIARVRAYAPPNQNPLFNQSDMVVTVETDAGITGIGEGGFKDTLAPEAGRLIGKDPQYIERLWQDMNRAFFYPAGREREDAIGALDLALWDIKGKVLKLPVHEVLGGMVRNYCECYNTAGKIPGVEPGMSIKERARLTIEAGYRAFRMGATDLPIYSTFNTHERLNQLYEDCVQAREGVGKNGDWCVDFHQRFNLSEAIRGCDLIQNLAPYFVEDPVRTEAFQQDIPILRQKVNVPIAAGEEWGNRWDFNKLVEDHSLDYVRATLPNVGGITEMMKIAAICETHFVGIIPHFTGPIATAALVNCLGTFSGPLLMEYNYGGRTLSYLPECLDFKNGKLYANDRPGLGVTVDFKQVKLVAEFTEPVTARAQTYFRPDGSITNW
ncbi:MAG TPA: mandelate racemase/muconate lactonizing enzyme family protein [Bryobacteraceae bacterium]|jgi:L-alanine-DL-glutamate epimerase-like enolase superfamily enzyme|nr:mandelate racemase/muconate lactonizing enzyme family protein [Bryobacteraceae bacterium]